MQEKLKHTSGRSCNNVEKPKFCGKANKRTLLTSYGEVYHDLFIIFLLHWTYQWMLIKSSLRQFSTSYCTIRSWSFHNSLNKRRQRGNIESKRPRFRSTLENILEETRKNSTSVRKPARKKLGDRETTLDGQRKRLAESQIRLPGVFLISLATQNSLYSSDEMRDLFDYFSPLYLLLFNLLSKLEPRIVCKW